MNPIFSCLPALAMTAIRSMNNSVQDDTQRITFNGKSEDLKSMSLGEALKEFQESEEYTKDEYDLFNHFVDEVSDMIGQGDAVEIKQEFPAFVVEGDRDDMYTLMSNIMLWSRDVDYHSNTIDAFEIAMDFENSYISFFMKPRNMK